MIYPCDARRSRELRGRDGTVTSSTPHPTSTQVYPSSAHVPQCLTEMITLSLLLICDYFILKKPLRCDEHWLLGAPDESLNMTFEANDVLCVG